MSSKSSLGVGIHKMASKPVRMSSKPSLVLELIRWHQTQYMAPAAVELQHQHLSIVPGQQSDATGRVGRINEQ
ncbi:hypothetical protein JOB18_004591 [Solea senegalensis]|uniref:Uncharacterized protein n=1 Tax=Solea senegalensis TaxID=28829 RepID=A0AAV6RQ28_SOLSE|nr:hypothetical protein JOB18_004591 [Solea senegalensis]